MATKKKAPPKKSPLKKIGDPAELECLGHYFTLSNAGMCTERMDKHIISGDFMRASGSAQGEIQAMAMDARSIGMTPDRLYSDLLKESREWAADAKKGDAYICEEWAKVKAGKR